MKWATAEIVPILGSSFAVMSVKLYCLFRFGKAEILIDSIGYVGGKHQQFLRDQTIQTRTNTAAVKFPQLDRLADHGRSRDVKLVRLDLFDFNLRIQAVCGPKFKMERSRGNLPTTKILMTSLWWAAIHAMSRLRMVQNSSNRRRTSNGDNWRSTTGATG